MKVLVTGVAGFIGGALAMELLKRGDTVIGIDNMNDYYDVGLKEARLARLRDAGGGAFSFYRMNIADKDAVFGLEEECKDVDILVNFAAQAGVRYSLSNPFAYTESNVTGFVVMMELARRLPRLRKVVYASSSSVYGGNTKIPFSVDDRVDLPISLYAATKRCNELMAYTYAHLYKTPCVGLRFFTVYGPWGRPDMATYFFVSKILKGEAIPVFNNGNMRRDFTFIDDAIKGVIGVLDGSVAVRANEPPSKVYNIGNSRPEKLMDFIAALENALGKKAVYEFLPLQPGDVCETFADIRDTSEAFGYDPKTTIVDGALQFVRWYKSYHRL